MVVVDRRAARGWVVIACVVLLACSPRAAAGFRFDADVGVVQSARDVSPCLAIAAADLAPGDTLLAVSADRPQGIAVVKIDARRAHPCTLPGDEWGSVSIERASFYNVTLRVSQGTFREPAITFRSNARLDLVGGVVTGDLDGDGRPERFAECTSREGVHLRVMTVTSDREIDRWHQYYYLPYDLESNCPGS